MRAAAAVALGVAGVLVVGWVDHQTGDELGLSLIYLAPVCAIAWWVGPRQGILLALLAAASWTSADLAVHGGSGFLVTGWNGATRAVIYSALAGLLGRVRRDELQAERERDRAQAAHANLQTFLTMVAHDLAGPLTTILGRVTLALRSPDLTDRGRSQLESVAGEVRRIERLVSDLLDAGRIGSGAFEVRPRPVDWAGLIRDVVRAQDTASTRHRIEVDVPERLEGEWDPDRLAQAVANLLSNAIRYSPNGGVIQVGVVQADGQVVVRVTDEGLGLTAEEIETIFSAFARASAAKEVPGTGLGLYITSGIIHAHGGQIWAESPGRGLGATFRFSLPTWGTDRDPAVRDAFIGKGPHP